jgi:DNA-binding CsgD family transcriptional regulator
MGDAAFIHYGQPLGIREREAARWFVLDLTQKEVAAEMGITRHAVHAHIGHVYIKLGLGSQLQLLAWALRDGLVTADELKAILPKARYHGNEEGR